MEQSEARWRLHESFIFARFCLCKNTYFFYLVFLKMLFSHGKMHTILSERLQNSILGWHQDMSAEPRRPPGTPGPKMTLKINQKSIQNQQHRIQIRMKLKQMHKILVEIWMATIFQNLTWNLPIDFQNSSKNLAMLIAKLSEALRMLIRPELD